jgi:hypothetical protein
MWTAQIAAWRDVEVHIEPKLGSHLAVGSFPVAVLAVAVLAVLAGLVLSLMTLHSSP